MAAKILITGATGQLGRAVVHFLLRKTSSDHIAALARDVHKAKDLREKGIAVRQGDYTDYASLLKAFSGIEVLHLVSTNALENVAAQHSNAIKAAEAANVKHVFFTSIVAPQRQSHVEIINDYKKSEDELIHSGLTYTILRSGYYMDMLPMFIGDALDSGSIRYPAGDGKASFTLRMDIAEATAYALLSSEEHQNTAYDLCPDQSYSFYDIALTLSELAGKPIEYVDMAVEDFKSELIKKQMPALEVKLMVELAEAIRHSEADLPGTDLKKLLGRQPTSLKEYLKETYF